MLMYPKLNITTVIEDYSGKGFTCLTILLTIGVRFANNLSKVLRCQALWDVRWGGFPYHLGKPPHASRTGSYFRSAHFKVNRWFKVSHFMSESASGRNAPSRPEWTTTLPTLPGYYWFIPRGWATGKCGRELPPVMVWLLNENRWANCSNDYQCNLLEYTGEFRAIDFAELRPGGDK